jgi:hypothetical protein
MESSRAKGTLGRSSSTLTASALSDALWVAVTVTIMDNRTSIGGKETFDEGVCCRCCGGEMVANELELPDIYYCKSTWDSATKDCSIGLGMYGLRGAIRYLRVHPC